MNFFLDFLQFLGKIIHIDVRYQQKKFISSETNNLVCLTYMSTDNLHNYL